MTTVIASVAALLLSVAILLAGNGLQGVLLPVRAQLEAFPTVSIGVLGSAYFLGFAAGCLLGPHLVRRVGHIRAFAAMTAVASAVALAHGLILVPMAWSLMRGITGFCFAVLYMVIESWLNERATNETRGVILSWYLIINLTVVTLGQLMLVLYDPRDFPLFALSSILVSLAAVPVALTAAAAPAPLRSVKVRPLRLYQVSPVSFVGCAVVGLANGAFWALGPVFAARVGMDATAIAVFMSLAVLGGAAGQWPLGRLSDRVDRRIVMLLAGTAVAVLDVVIYVYATRASGVLFALTASWGVFAFALYTIAVAHANDFAEPDQFVEISGGLLLVYASGAILGPILAATLMAFGEERVLYLYMAATHGLLALFVLARMRLRAPAPEIEHHPFVEALQAAQTVSTTFEEEIHASHEHESREASGIDEWRDTGKDSTRRG